MADDGRLEYSHAFYRAELRLFRAGPEAYITMIAATAARKLEAAGGIGPFEYQCFPKDGELSPHIMIAREQ